MMEETGNHEAPSEVVPNVEVKLTELSDVVPVPDNTGTSLPVANLSEEMKESMPAASNQIEEKAQRGVWGWIKSASSNQFLQKFVEKTKSGVDRMITTLDPGMTPYLREGGEICFVVASDKEVKWCAIRDAFQQVFGAATVTGIATQSNIAPQPVGYTAGMKGAQERIKYLRKSGLVEEKQPCIAVEHFIVEQSPDHWFDVGCILLDDPYHQIVFEIFTLSVPVDPDVVTTMQQATPNDYDRGWSGLAMTVGEAIQKELAWVNPSDWHRAIAGRSLQDIIYSAGLLLAELYKRRLPGKKVGEDI